MEYERMRRSWKSAPTGPASVRAAAASGAIALALIVGRAGAELPVTPIPEDPVLPALADVIVSAPEPRYVAPTRRDSIGRIWAPVLINGHGPFRLVLDTGATHSAVIARVADSLGVVRREAGIELRGVTGHATVPVIPVESLVIGDMVIEPAMLPIVTDALGGAEGILGTEGLFDKRIFIDFRHDRISIMRSHGERAMPGFITVPVVIEKPNLLVVNARVGTIQTKAIIDTGGQSTIANTALKLAIMRHRDRGQGHADEVTGATLDVQSGTRLAVPVIALGGTLIRGASVTFGDMYIFEHWKMTDQPTMLVGMDVLGLLDVLIIDYRRKELQMQMRTSPL
jgi:hypothetical protein